jgi:fumarate reductase subunit D
MSTPNANEPQNKKDSEDKLIAAIGYLGILCLIPLLLKPKSQFCKFHGKQGLILTIGWVINFVIGVIPVIGWFLGFLGMIALAILSIIGIIKSLNGEYWEMPYLGEYAKKLNI